MATGVSPSVRNRWRYVQEDDTNHQQRRSQHSTNPPIDIQPSVKPHDGGYDCKFVKRPSSDLGQADCPVCLLVLREPQQVTCCGYSYCRSCIQRVLADKNVCPTCNEQFTTFPNKGLKRALYAQKVYCVHHVLGCWWKGELGELDRHLNLQPPQKKLFKGCPFSGVECTFCLQVFQRRYLQDHQSDCPNRPFACQYCNQHEATFEEVTQSHWLVCPSFPLPCPNNCDCDLVPLVLQRQELEQHVGQDCPLTLIPCDFHIAGCEVCLPRKDLPSHIHKNIVLHISLLELHMTKHPGEKEAACMVLMVGTIQKMATENACTCRQLCETKEELQESNEQLCELCTSLKSLQKSHTQLRTSFAALRQSHAKKLSELFTSSEEWQRSHTRLHRTNAALRSSIDNLNTLQQSHVEQLSKLCTSSEEWQRSHTQLHRTNAVLRSSIDNLNTLQQSHDRQLSELYTLSEELQRSYTQLFKSYGAQRLSIDNLDISQQSHVEQLSELCTSFEELQRSHAQLSRSKSVLDSSVNDLNTSLGELRSSHENLQRSHYYTQNELHDVQEKVKLLTLVFIIAISILFLFILFLIIYNYINVTHP